MDWLVVFIIGVGIVLPVGVGLGLGVYRAAQSPEMLMGAASFLVKALAPLIKEFVSKRNPPKVERRMLEVIRRGGEWDNVRKRERRT